MMPSAQLTVDTSAVAWNTRLFAGRTNGHLLAVLKADAFGHGDLAPIVLAGGATWLGTTSISDALVLRSRAAETRILSWLNPVDAPFEEALLADLDLAVPSEQHLHAISVAAAATGRVARIHLHVDLGINRDGAARGEWSALCQLAWLLTKLGRIRVDGIMGHLSSADDPQDPANRRERMLFDNAVRVARTHGLRPVVRHLAATAATLTQPDALYDLSRIGAGLYGIDPARSTTLRPALTLTAPVVSVKRVPRGSGVGYSHTWSTTRDTNLALLPLGYGDGLPRTASGRAWVQVRGRRRPIVGLFSMDQVVVDTGDDQMAPGDVATVFGAGGGGEPTVRDWAEWAGTIDHDIVVGIGARVQRRLTPSVAGTVAAEVSA
ncbi:alanine racemase [Frondihabitans sp. VKM Ac-2883]|jgi:alanine racemase|uniref:alanine racemase n=1 Tax=Frondihabitans sp. VKM Ac-2883 TaxID=2783823 RepID=UPI00188D8694|nr:alanine racemase [Frondihabitans sp. VKM Ac-2883]MBF4575387.1 alanine racemase [Frondihabitans sp. VKM Ac-2883]